MAEHHPIVRSIRQRLQHAADPEKAPRMQAYMKTEQPFLGIQAPLRREVVREVLGDRAIDSFDDYRRVVEALWRGKHREEQYVALEVAARLKRFRTDQAWVMYERMLRTAENWDTVDHIASHLVGDLVRRNRVWEDRLREWRSDPNVWVRRASLLAHLRHKEETNVALLGETIDHLASDKDFFIRKAIGWVLREYAKTDPAWVRRFVKERQGTLSGLSKREALKNL